MPPLWKVTRLQEARIIHRAECPQRVASCPSNRIWTTNSDAWYPCWGSVGGGERSFAARLSRCRCLLAKSASPRDANPATEHCREDMAAGSHKLRMRESFRGDLTFLWIARRDVGVVLDRSLRALDAEHYVECPRAVIARPAVSADTKQSRCRWPPVNSKSFASLKSPLNSQHTGAGNGSRTAQLAVCVSAEPNDYCDGI